MVYTIGAVVIDIEQKVFKTHTLFLLFCVAPPPLWKVLFLFIYYLESSFHLINNTLILPSSFRGEQQSTSGKSSQIDRQTTKQTEEQRTTGAQESPLEPLVQVG